MDRTTITALFDELEKIALAGGQLSVSSTPKTPAATPAPAARVAPTPVAKAPVSAPPAAPRSGLGAIRNQGLRAQVANTRALTSYNPPAPQVSRGTIQPKKTPAPNLRSVTTMPVRQPAKPAFVPDNSNMGQYVRPLRSSDLFGR